MRRQTRGFAVIEWIETHCVFTQGMWIGKPFRLLKWQKRLILELFATGEDGLRLYRWAYISVPKKQGKTELAAALALYLLIGDGEPSPLIACAAAADKQADLVFGAAKKMCEMSPTLKAITLRFDSEIQVPSIPGAVLRRVAASGGMNDGPSWSGMVLDELHEWQGDKGERTWEVLTNGVGARQQPLIIQITTAGYDLDTICGKQYLYAKRVQSGEVSDPGYLVWINEAPEGADHTDPAVWAECNPSYGTTVQASFYRDQLTKKSEATFRRYFLNQWTDVEEIAIPADAWSACQSSLGLDTSRPAFVGIDFAQVSDSCAVAIAQRIPTTDGKDRTVVRTRVWSNPYQDGDARHDLWQVSHAEVENHLRTIHQTYRTAATEDEKGRPIAGPAFYYDPARFEQSAQTLRLEGLNMVKYDQTDLRMVPVAETFRQLVVSGALAHDGDAVLASHVAAIERVERPRGGWRMGKKRGKKNDAAVASGMAAYEAQRTQPKRPAPAPLVAYR